jgi:thioesterase domain-containing protein
MTHKAARCYSLVRNPGYHLGGYSFGGRVAFEMARQVRARGDGVRLLALFDTYGPGFPGILPLHRRLREHVVTLLRLGGRERRDYLAARLHRVAARCDRVVSRLTPGVRFLVPTPLRADFDRHRAASARYRPGVYPGRLTLLRAREQPRALGADYGDPALGWGCLAAGGVAVHEVPGTHLTLFDDENVGDLAGAVRGCLA